MSIRDQDPGGRARRLLGAGLRTLGRGVVAKLPLGDKVARTAQYWTEVGTDWANTLGELRGAAMKLGQLASQYADILPPQLAEQLQRLQNSVEPLPFDQIEPLLDDGWSERQRAQLESIEPKALAAASIGQVHRARLVDGRAVVVKLRYPGVDQAVDADMAQLRKLIGMSKLLPLNEAALDRLMDEVRERFREETDYRNEVRNLLELRQHCAVDGILYPEPVEDLCTPTILVASEMRGQSLEAARGWTQPVRDALGDRIAEWALHSFFIAHRVHADPHPGNFAFRADGHVVVYDYGCVKHVPANTVATARELLIAALDQDWDGVHRALLALDGVENGLKPADAHALYADLYVSGLAPLLAGERYDFADPRYIDDNRAVAMSHLRLSIKFKPVSDLIFVMRALSGWYWLLRGLGARVALREPLQRYLDASAPERISGPGA